MVYNKINWENGSVQTEGHVTIDGVQYQTVQPEYTGNTPINADNLNHMDDGIYNAISSLYYKTGDTYTIPGQLYLSGALFGSRNTVAFTIFLPKKLDNINSISVSNLNVAVRHTDGGYWANGDIADANVAVASFTNNYVTITIESSTASGTGNTPCNVYIRSLNLTFN